MSKIDPPVVGTYTPTQYVTGDEIIKHYDATKTVATLPVAKQQKYLDFAIMANRAVEKIIYKYVDTLPLAINDEALTYAKGMAFYYAIWLKQAEDGATNASAMKTIWTDDKASLIEVLQSQPKQVTTRRIVSRAFGDTITPYSQSGPGAADIL